MSGKRLSACTVITIPIISAELSKLSGAADDAQILKRGSNLQINRPGGILEILIAIAGPLLTAAILLGAAIFGLYVLNKTVGKEGFTSITVLIAIVGAVIAIQQFTINVNEKPSHRARMLRTAIALNDDTIKMCTRPVHPNYIGELPDHDIVPASLLKQRTERLEQIYSALDKIDISDMPSAGSAAGLVRARTAAKLAITDGRSALSANTDANFSVAVNEAANAYAALGAERDRLYPYYMIGPLGFQSTVAQE
jgi:hypothetical protein